MSEIVVARDIETVTAEIVVIKQNLQMQLLSGAVEIGRRLTEAKKMVPHGQWGTYLTERVEFSQSTAHNMMRLYEEYGDKEQQSLFGVNSQAIEGLSVTAAIRLLSLPEGERETFIAENNVADMSTRELEAAIKEANEARAKAEAAEAARRAAVDELDAVRQEDSKARKELKEATEKADFAEKKAAALQAQLDKAKKAAEKAKKEAEDAKAEKSQVPEDLMEQLQSEARAAAAEAAKAETEAKVAALQKKVEAAEAAKAEAEKKLEAAAKAQQMNSQEAAAFKTMFSQVQEDFNKLTGYLMKIQSVDAELAGKLRRGLNALLDKMQEELWHGN